MTQDYFTCAQDSHTHSLLTLELLYQYSDFMESIDTLVDMGCGAGMDLEWWATRTTNEDTAKPLNINCYGVDLDTRRTIGRYPNINYLIQDFGDPIQLPRGRTFDVIWCHDAFQFVIDPFRVLNNWYHCLSEDGMLVIVVPQTTNVRSNQQDFAQRSQTYWHWTVVNLMHVLAVSGFDCAGGFWFKDVADPWLHAVVYKSKHRPMDPVHTSWYDLQERGLLPESAAACVQRHGHVRQVDLCLPWLDRMMYLWSRH